jgi:hypothetical protein
MKRIDMNKVYAFIGKTVVWTSLWAMSVLGVFYAITNCITVYR